MKQSKTRGCGIVFEWAESILDSLPGVREHSCCRAVASLFSQLTLRAGRMAEGKRVELFCPSEDQLRRVKWREKCFAVKNHSNDKWGTTPDLCAELGKALTTSARLDAMPPGKEKKEKARRMAVEWARLYGAAEMRAKCLFDWICDNLEAETGRAKADVQIAQLKIQLASSEKDRKKAHNDLAKAKDDLAKAQDNRTLLERICREQDELLRGQEKLQTSADRIEEKADGHEAMLQKLPDAVSDALYSHDPYSPKMLEEGQKIREGFKRGEQKSYDWGPLLKKYGYPTDEKKQASFLRTLQADTKRKRK